MKLTQELIDKIQEAMLHTNLKGEINWKDGDDIEVQIAGTFAKDKFIVLKNASKNPFENAQPHPHFDYEKKVFTKDPTKLTLIDPGDEVEFFEISKKEYSKFNEQK